MKKLSIAFLLFVLAACNAEKKEENNTADRWVCVSKQYNEIIAALGLTSKLVAVDLSSVNPSSIKDLPKVGYHRALATESILSFEPSLFIHDNNVGPDHVMKQLAELKIPMKAFTSEGKDLESTYDLIMEMGTYFKCKKKAMAIVRKMKTDIAQVVKEGQIFTDQPTVLIIHYGRAKNHYLLVTEKSPAAMLVKMAGGKLSMPGEKNMKMLSSELLAQANPDVILITDYGYDRLAKKNEMNTLPGISETNAAKNNRIYRINEFDVMYFGVNSAKQIGILQSLIHQK